MAWRRVGREFPCPVCDKPDWCGVSDRGVVVICMRVESPRPSRNGGWIHDVGKDRPLEVPRPPTRRDPPASRADLAAMIDSWEDNGAVEGLAARTGTTARSLRKIGCRVSPSGAYGFPMLSDRRQVVGIRLRLPNGRKLAVRGSREGLFLPGIGVESVQSYVVVCEGPTDTAAALDWGFEAVGRPSCAGGIRFLVPLLRRRRVVILADRDEAGDRGAHRLAKALADGCRWVKVTRPPPPHKDVRDWMRSGISEDVVRARIASAKEVR